MKINKFLKLLEYPLEDKVDIAKKVVYFQNYAFLFRDRWLSPQDLFVTGQLSSKFSSLGVWRRVVSYSVENLDLLRNIDEVGLEDTKQDFLFGGILRTLLPTLKFGGYESLFSVWVFVKTPEDFLFPFTFYYGQSGTSLGGWGFGEAKKIFPSEFFSIINFSPFDFSDDELDAFINAFEISLSMVPVSDYYGVYQGDRGYTLMGVKDGRPYFLDLGWSYNENKISEYIKTVKFF